MEDEQEASHRLTVTFVPNAWREVMALVKATRDSRSTVISRAVSIYYLVHTAISSGQDVVLRDRATRQEKVLHIL